MKIIPLASLFQPVQLPFLPIVNAHEEKRHIPYDLGISLKHLSYSEKMLLAAIETHRKELPEEQAELIENLMHMAATAREFDDNRHSFNFYAKQAMDNEPKLLPKTREIYERMMAFGILRDVQQGVGQLRLENRIALEVKELDDFLSKKQDWKKVDGGNWWEKDVSTGYLKRQTVRISRGFIKGRDDYVRVEVNYLKGEVQEENHYFSMDVMELARM